MPTHPAAFTTVAVAALNSVGGISALPLPCPAPPRKKMLGWFFLKGIASYGQEKQFVRITKVM